MTYKELYIQLENELIESYRKIKEGLYNHDALDNMNMFSVSEVFESLELYETINNVNLKWDDKIVDNLELACRNDMIMFISELKDIEG